MRYLFLLTFLLTLMFIPNTQAVWWDADFDSCINITADNEQVIYEQTNFPGLIVLNDSRIDYADTMDNGEDIRVVDTYCNNSGSLVDYEIELWNESGNSYVFYEYTTLSNTTNTTYSVYYNNSLAIDSQDQAGVWGNNYLAVWHLTDEHDSLNTYNLTMDGTVNFVTGTVGNAAFFDDNTANFLSATIDSTIWNAANTWSAFARPIEDESSAYLGFWDSGTDGRVRFFWTPSVSLTQNRFNVNVNVVTTGINNWNHQTGTFAGTGTGAMVNYVNGTFTNTGTKADSITAPTDDVFGIGRAHDDTNVMNGSVDEVRLSDVVRTAQWINTTYITLVDGLITYGSVITDDSPPSTITANLTVNVFQEENPSIAIDDFVAQFIAGGVVNTFGINKSFVAEHTDVDYGNFSYDNDFTTNSTSSTTHSVAGSYQQTLQYINGTLLVGSSESICVTFRYIKTGTTGTGGTVLSSINLLVDDVNVGRTSYTQTASAATQDSGTVTSCFAMSPDEITEDISVMLNYTSTIAASKDADLFFFVTEVHVEEQIDEETIVIDQIDLVDGTNRIFIEDASDLFFQREYVIIADFNGSNQNIIAYLIERTEDIAQTTIAVINAFGVPQSGANVNIEKVIGSSFVTVTEGLTDDVGLFSAILVNNDFYRATVSLAGFTTQVVEFRAQSITITIILNQTVTLGFVNVLQDITILLSPQIITYNSTDVYHNVSFEYGISSNSSLLVNYALSLECNNTLVNDTEGSTPTGGTLSTIYNVVGCNNITMNYNFTKNDSSIYVNSVIFYPSVKQQFGLNEALARMAAEYDTSMINFLIVIIFIIVAGALTIISPEVAGIAWFPIGGIFVYYGMMSVSLFVLIGITMMSVLLIKRRWL